MFEKNSWALEKMIGFEKCNSLPDALLLYLNFCCWGFESSWGCDARLLAVAASTRPVDATPTSELEPVLLDSVVAFQHQ